MRLWRIVDARHVDAAFSGEGSLGHPARWHSGRLPIVYTATTQALAALEVLVHVDDRRQLRFFRLIPCDVDDDLVTPLPDDLPRGWHRSRGTAETRAFGDRWLESGSSYGLAVPSALVKGVNVLLNPRHAGHGRLDVGEVEEVREGVWG